VIRPLKFFSLILGLSCSLSAQSPVNRVVFDATAAVPEPRPVLMQLGSNRAPDGSLLGANNQYLTRDGKPWIPVMGEFHYSRYPEAYWEEEILKMKASGVNVIATYVIWIHHEEIEGQFDWSGQRDLRKFAELCARHNMLLYPRIGPWAHGEARNGGFPDWVLKNGPVRSNNPIYLAEVKTFYAQIGEQLHGLLWKDGGPVIGIQIENEYAGNGPGQGREHLAALKDLAIGSGLDVPFYTVTGWDNAVVPDDLFLPVYGGYPDAPWDASTQMLPPAEIYSFRFASRVAANMGVIGGDTASGSGNDAALRSRVPFLTAEVGGGIQDTYHRRPLLSPDDVPAMIPVMIGSGANMLGYYMFHGGENPDGKLTTLQESQRTGYPTDVPMKSYDFQAPIGEFGQMNSTLRELKLYHYFLNDFGAQLAAAPAIAPARQPAGPADTSVLRASVRIKNGSGFLFVNNYIREAKMPARQRTQFEVKLPEGSLLLPATPITIPENSYCFWPINLDILGIPLRYATAQPILRLRQGGDTYIFFAETTGVAAEFAFRSEDKHAIQVINGSPREQSGLLRIENVRPGLGAAISVHASGESVHLVLLSAADAKKLWRVNLNGRDQLILTGAQVYSDGAKLVLRQINQPAFAVKLFPPSALTASAGTSGLAEKKQDGLFQSQSWQLPEHPIAISSAQSKPFGDAPVPVFGPKLPWRNSVVVMKPDESSFASAAAWNLTLPASSLNGLSDIYLTMNYRGDIARLLDGDRLLTDNFFNGSQWQVGLKRFLGGASAHTFTLQILPLGNDTPIFFEPGAAPARDKGGKAGSLQSIQAIPEYELDLHS
jgi:hypothetical protein